jgi:3-oxoacyl-(acyl-carrier-protein) synthase
VANAVNSESNRPSVVVGQASCLSSSTARLEDCPTIAIAGCGAVAATGLGLAPLQPAVAANTSALSRREILLGKTPQTIVAGFVPDEIVAELRAADAVHADSRAFLFAAAALREAVENAGAVLDSISPPRRGFVLSTTKANIEALDQLVRQQPVSAVAQRQIQPAFLAADLAETFACRGPVQCVSAACISGLSALQQGAALIRRGLADVVFVAGVDLISHFVLSGFNTLKSLDPDGCRPFDKARIGLSLGEGAGAIILAKGKLLHAPLIRLTGTGTSNDANHLTGPSRDGSGLALAIQRALAKAGLAPEQIDFVNAHGTGTPYNDNMEALALRSVFGDRVPPFNSSKGIFGHTLGAAGVLETILCVAALQTKLLPGTPRLRDRDPVAPESLLAEPRAAAKLDRVLKVNCGFGGTNAALILERELP